MSAKHTPGPWSVKQRKILDGYKFFIESKNFVCLCEISCSTNTLWDSVCGASEAEANARLISAAPDLLDAIIELRDAYQEFMRLPAFKANAAIAKATGEQ